MENIWSSDFLCFLISECSLESRLTLKWKGILPATYRLSENKKGSLRLKFAWRHLLRSWSKLLYISNNYRWQETLTHSFLLETASWSSSVRNLVDDVTIMTTTSLEDKSKEIFATQNRSFSNEDLICLREEVFSGNNQWKWNYFCYTERSKEEL